MWKNLVTGRLVNGLTALVSAILLIFNVHTVNPQNPKIDLSGYTLTFQDEFDGEALNTSVWHTQNSNGIRKGGYWSDQQCSLRDGNLVITTEYKENGEFGAGWYTCGISTRYNFEQTYGYYECRCMLPKGKGLWSAFWLTCPGANQVTGSGTKGAEIDIFESPYGYKSGEKSWKVTSNIHYNGYEWQTRYKNIVISALDNNPYENYNTYGLLWTEDEYVFYVNGIEVARTDYGGVSQQPEYPILSCEIDGAAGTPTYGWSGNINQNEGGKDFTAEFIVDYIRVYAEVQ